MPNSVNLLDPAVQLKLGLDKAPRVQDARYGEQFITTYQYARGTGEAAAPVDVSGWTISVVAARYVFDIDRNGKIKDLVEENGQIIREVVEDKIIVKPLDPTTGIMQLGSRFDAARWNPAPGKATNLPGVLAQVYRKTPHAEAEIDNFLFVYRHGVDGPGNEPLPLVLPVEGFEPQTTINIETGEILPVPLSAVKSWALTGNPGPDKSEMSPAFQAFLDGLGGGIIADVAPSADTIGGLIYRSGSQEFYETKAVGGIVPQSATFAPYTDAAFMGNYADRASLPAPSVAGIGTWAVTTDDWQAYRQFRDGAGSMWTPIDIHRILGGGLIYVEEYASDTEAQLHVTQIGDVYGNTELNQLRQARTFTPASGEPTRYESKRIIHEDDLVVEQDRRADGDQFVEYELSDGAFEGIIQLHDADGHAAILHVTADFTTATRSYVTGQRWYLAPHHNQEAEMRLLSQPGGSGEDEAARRAAAAAQQRAEGAERLANEAGRLAARKQDMLPARPRLYPQSVSREGTIAGDYTLFLDALNQAVLFDPYTAPGQELNRLQISEANTGTVVHDAFWGYSQNGNQDIRFSISQAEGQAIGSLGAATYVEFRIRFGRGAGNNFVPVVDAPRVLLAVGNRAEYPASRDDVAVNTNAIEQEKTRIDALERHGTIHNIRLTPRGGPSKADVVGTYGFEPIDPTDVPAAAVAVVVTVSNGLVGAEASSSAVAIVRNWSRTGGVRQFEITQAQYDNALSLISGVTDHFEFQFRLYPAGAIADSVTNPGAVGHGAAIGTEVVDWFIGAHQGDDEPDLQLQEPVNGADDAGVLTVTLPEHYDDRWRFCAIAMWDSADDRIAEKEIRTSLLAIQDGPRNVMITGNPAANGAMEVIWTPSARTLACRRVTRQVTATRIIFCELHN